MKKYSLTLLTIGACTASAMLASSASAAIATYSNFGYWQSDVTATGKSVATETFDSYNGFYPSLSGTTGGIAWNADAPGGIFIGYISSGLFSTNNPVAATFTFSPGIFSVGGNIFGTDIGFNYVEARITVVLSDGSSYIGRTTGPADFVGFISDGAAISSMTLSATGPTPGGTYVTMDNLYLGVVPGPSSLALLACAGLTAARRRRS